MQVIVLQEAGSKPAFDTKSCGREFESPLAHYIYYGRYYNMSLLGQYEYVIDKTHPRANKDGSVYLHIIVAETTLGRHLLPEEVVHHKDLNKLNNNPDNLMVFATKSDHTCFHQHGCDESILMLNENGAYVCEQNKYICSDCGTEIAKGSTRCRDCADKHNRKVNRPTSNELFNVLISSKGNFTSVGKMYGVTDNSIRKWCVLYSIPSKSSFYRNEINKMQR